MTLTEILTLLGVALFLVSGLAGALWRLKNTITQEMRTIAATESRTAVQNQASILEELRTTRLAAARLTVDVAHLKGWTEGFTARNGSAPKDGHNGP